MKLIFNKPNSITLIFLKLILAVTTKIGNDQSAQNDYRTSSEPPVFTERPQNQQRTTSVVTERPVPAIIIIEATTEGTEECTKTSGFNLYTTLRDQVLLMSYIGKYISRIRLL